MLDEVAFNDLLNILQELCWKERFNPLLRVDDPIYTRAMLFLRKHESELTKEQKEILCEVLNVKC